MRRNLRQSILKSMGRYLAIVLIIALGAGIFVGLRTTKAAMIATGQTYMDKQNMFDLRLLSTYGWTDEQLEEIKKLDGVASAEGVIWMDAVVTRDGSDAESVYKLYAIPETVNKVHLLGGRMPTAPNECLYDGAVVNDSILGMQINVSTNNPEDTLESLTAHTFTVVGYVSTPLYMDMSRGTTSLGNGSLSAYLYLPRETFDLDYYTEINVTIPGDYGVYTAAYDDAMEAAAERLEPQLEPYALQRYDQLLKDANEAYTDGLHEYLDGYSEYRNGRKEAEAELAEAYAQLLEAQQEIDDNRATLEEGFSQLEEGQRLLDEKRKELADGKQALKNARVDAERKMEEAYVTLLENYRTASESLPQIEAGYGEIEEGLAQLDDGIAQLKDGLGKLEVGLGLAKGMVAMIQPSVDAAQNALDLAKTLGAGPLTIAGLEKNLKEITAKRDEYAAQVKELEANKATYSQQLKDLQATREEVAGKKAELDAAKAEVQAGLKAIEAGFKELEEQKALAEEEFAAAEAQLASGQRQLDAGQKELDENRSLLEEGMEALEAGEKELKEAWAEYDSGKAEADAEFAKAEAELADAREQLDDAWETIRTLEEPEVFVLDRNTNMGYISLDSNSSIVEGISVVFPAFFLLIAALVCITTMTRMVEEERTQIGTLKALGYSNAAIIGKYLAYAGSAAVIGCGLGVVVGSVVFPLILWQAYGIILTLTPGMTLVIDWPLCLLVVTVYTAVTMLVTWYCCRMALREVPAELIRPKPPTTGRKIFLEYLPFWNRISFLNKVTLRNIFRYRQRLLMMMVGIGGCSALLLTGFGVRDSIVDIVDIQFEEVTLYDMEVRFAEAPDEDGQEAFRKDVGSYAKDICFFHQSTMELAFDGKTADITMIAATDHLADFLDFHVGQNQLAYPGKNEALISCGVAERLNIGVGDTVTVRNTEMKSLTLTVSGIYDNHVSNFVVLHPDTVEAQWEEIPAQQIACVLVADGYDVHEAGARIQELEGVMTLSISEDLAEQVGGMLEALNLVVVTVVICAGLLAVIVLYNLTNINITERIREIATIKVLGFRAGESAMYVFKENLILSAMGAVVGLGGGYLLLSFVMSQIKVNMVWFQARLQPQSYVWTLVLTMVFACLVDFALYFKLEKINMAEALKSVE